METLIVKNLRFSYFNMDILKNINFEVSKGSICGLLGPNGSGKTTLLKCINGVRKPYNGDVLLDGVSIYKMQREKVCRLISMVPQQSNIVFPYTVLDMVILGKAPTLGWTGKPSLSDIEEALEMLEYLKIYQLKDRIFNELSGGERQMVMIARALFQNTEVILLDEPTSHLDYKNQYTILEKVRNISLEKGLTTLITLHDPNLANYYCSNIVMLKHGEILYDGDTENGMQSENLSHLYSMKINIEWTSKGSKIILPQSS